MQTAPANPRWSYSSSMDQENHSNWPPWAAWSRRMFDLTFMKRHTLTSWNAQSPIRSLRPNRSWSTSNIPSKKNLPNTPPNVSSSPIAWVRVCFVRWNISWNRISFVFLLAAGRECGRSGPVRWHLGEALQRTNCHRYSSLQLQRQVSDWNNEWE